MIEFLKENKGKISRAMIIGGLSFGCAGAPAPVLSQTGELLREQIDVCNSDVCVTRLNTDFFLVGDNRYYDGTGNRIRIGVTNMRLRGCDIKDIFPIAAAVAKVEVNNGRDCLPEMQ